MATFKTLYKCHVCGTTSYQREMVRMEDGALRPLGGYKCTGCRNIFDSIRAWYQPRRFPEFSSSNLPSGQD